MDGGGASIRVKGDGAWLVQNTGGGTISQGMGHKSVQGRYPKIRVATEREGYVSRELIAFARAAEKPSDTPVTRARPRNNSHDGRTVGENLETMLIRVQRQAPGAIKRRSSTAGDEEGEGGRWVRWEAW